MPWGDRTGPLGYGPMTGRAAGLCAGYPYPGFANPVPGRGFGRGFGRGWGMGRGGGWGRRNWFYATGLPGWQRTAFGYPPQWGYAPHHAAPYYPPYEPGFSKEAELNELKQQAQQLEDTLEGIKGRMAELEAGE